MHPDLLARVAERAMLDRGFLAAPSAASLAARIGADVLDGVLDGVLKDFYLAHVGTAARLQDMVDFIRTQTGYDATVCATAWLKADAAPTGALATACP